MASAHSRWMQVDERFVVGTWVLVCIVNLRSDGPSGVLIPAQFEAMFGFR